MNFINEAGFFMNPEQEGQKFILYYTTDMNVSKLLKKPY